MFLRRERLHLKNLAGIPEQADEAFEWLERAYDQRDPGLAEIKTEPLLSSLRHDKRYAAFVKKILDWGGTVASLGCPREHMVARETWFFSGRFA